MKLVRKAKEIYRLLRYGTDRIERLAAHISSVEQQAAAMAAGQERMIQELTGRVDRMDRTLRRVAEAEPDYLKKLAEHISVQDEVNEILNRSLTTHNTVWGDKNRLHISPKADVYTCFFNTNSGSIYVGDYTFAGSGVSILAGSHDYRLKGLLRRDVELTEGCDITIGKGVWLASGCILLGPCTVEDNAVIAAGAVVIPGTHVRENSIYGGVPAREIGMIEEEKGDFHQSPAIRSALSRNGDILYAEGWSSKKNNVIEGIGHWLEDDEGILYANRRKWKMSYFLEGESENELIFSSEQGNRIYPVSSGAGEVDIELPWTENDGVMEIRARLRDPGARVFMRLKEEVA